MATSYQDRQEIQDLLFRYAYILDIEGTEEEFVSLFTEDAVFDSPHSGHHAGLQGLREFYRKSKSRQQQFYGSELGDQVRHVITNCVTSIDGDRATLRAYFLGTKTPRNAANANEYRRPELLWSGSYDCTARRVDGKWRLDRRTVHVDPSAS